MRKITDDDYKWSEKAGLVIFIAFCVVVAACSICLGQGVPEAVSTIGINSSEAAILNKVAIEYGLNEEETKLLFIIRKIENGSDGIEMGVLTPSARRFKGDPNRSLRLQAQWAAGTIKKRYNGNLKDFSDRWCPIGASNDPDRLNENWYGNAVYYFNKSV